MRKKFYIGDFEITVREIIASVSIIAIMLLFGVLINGKISEHQMDKNEIYNKAIKIESKDLFQYGMDTNVGNAFVYGELKAVDTVTYPEIGGEYMYVEKTEEHYNRHTRIVTKTRTNSEGETETYTEEEVYYSWDYYDSWSQHSNKISFLGVEFDYGRIERPYDHHITTQKGRRSDIRFIYRGTKANFKGTIFTELRDKTISQGTNFYDDMTIEETVEYLESGIGWLIFFWFFWIILIAGCVVGFYYLDNRWLE